MVTPLFRLMFFSLLILTAPLEARGEPIVGQARVVDGDTLWIGEFKIRLHGIDAPESKQSCMKGSNIWNCGVKSTEYLKDLIGNEPVSCEELGRDRYKRVIGKCRTTKFDLGVEMVRAGMALAYQKYSEDYVSIQEKALSRKVGMFAGAYIAPWDWRKGKRLNQSNSSSGVCTIKGNINSSGERIFHTPSSPWYSRTKINEQKGERWFCSEEAAVLAGWRAPKL